MDDSTFWDNEERGWLHPELEGEAGLHSPKMRG